MRKVLILAGSESDRPTLEPALEILRASGVEAQLQVSSAHRQPQQTAEIARTAREKGYGVIICGAGLSAALPGFVASHTDVPVIGVPVPSGPLAGMDALLSTVQMPAGVPVACVGIGNAKNAAYLALRILGVRASG